MCRIVVFAWPLFVFMVSASEPVSAQTVRVEGASQTALLAEREVELQALQREVARLQKELGLVEPQLRIEARFIEVDLSEIPSTSKARRDTLIWEYETRDGRATDTIPVVNLDADSPLLKQIELWQSAPVKCVEIVGSPTVTTLVGKPALVRIGSEVPLLTSSQSGETKVENRFQGVQLEVMGLLRYDGKVQLQLRPRQSELDFKQGVKFNGQEVPYLTVKECDKQIVMTSDQTVVIGGLTRSRTVTTEPARLFKPAKTEVKEFELLIVVNVAIIHPKPSAAAEVAVEPTAAGVR